MRWLRSHLVWLAVLSLAGQGPALGGLLTVQSDGLQHHQAAADTPTGTRLLLCSCAGLPLAGLLATLGVLPDPVVEPGVLVELGESLAPITSCPTTHGTAFDPLPPRS